MFDCGIIDDNKKHTIRKGDIFFMLAILVASFVSFLIIKLQSAEGSYAALSFDGSVLTDQILLEQPKEVYYLITYADLYSRNINNICNIKYDIYYNSTLEKNIVLNKSSALNQNIALNKSSVLNQNNTVNNNITIQKLSAAEWEATELPDCEYNVFVCADNEIRMLQSSCPDKICVHHSAISDTGENIICLPHKLVIEIKGGKENDLDGVAY